MTALLSLDDLLKESTLQATARKVAKHIGHTPTKNSGQKAKPVNPELAETVAMLRQWDHRREWSHSANVLTFTRQQCNCCGETSHTFDGMFLLYTNNRVKGATKFDRVTVFELDKPKEVVYRDAVVPICHYCADSQQDWPLQED